MYTQYLFRRNSVFAFILGAASLAGCNQASVSGHAQVDGRSQQLSGIGALTTMAGTYTGCQNITDGTTWTAGFGTGASGGPSVIEGDTGCQLAITSVQEVGGSYLAAAPLGILADGSFNGTSVKFVDVANAQNFFYADVMMLPANFAADFTLDFLHSKNPVLLPQTVNSQYQMHTSSVVTDDSVPAPQYALSFPSAPYLTNVSNVIVSVNASAPTFGVTLGGQTAESYAILANACPADPQSVYPAMPTSIASAPAFSDFGISLGVTVSATVSIEKCLVVAHCDAGNASICSYQMFDVTFN